MAYPNDKNCRKHLKMDFGTPQIHKTKELMTPLEWRIFCKHRQLMK